MIILVTNDDGINSPGLQRLVQELAHVGEVYVVAPEREQSACGHAITLHKPLRMTPIALPKAASAYATNGTPADCVILGTLGDLPRPDIVVSGINAGANLGEEVLYSGTCSAAMEAVLQDLRAIAVSVCAYTDVLYDAAAQYAAKLVRAVEGSPSFPENTFLNMNLPNVAPEALREPLWTRLGRRKYSNILNRRDDPRGRPYYWFSGSPMEHDAGEGTDIRAVREGHVSITPVHFDLTGDLSHAELPGIMRRLREDDT